jgi:Ca2+-binding RTX toxin-like protein
MATVIGTDTANWLAGTGGTDLIKGFGGDDTLKGGGGADQLYGGTGIDSAIYADSPTGVGVSLTDGIGYGGSAEGDRLFSIENVYGSGYRDELVGNGGANSLYGLSGDDALSGGGGGDLLDGADGDDMLKGGGGADVLIGGIGTDVADYRGAPGGVFVSLIDNAGHWSDAQGDAFYGIENVWGSMDHADVLIGDHGGNHLKGFGGADELRGHGGDDLLEGGNGADTMIGGGGNDTYMVRDATDVIVESGGQGTDSVYTEVSYVLTPGADVEILAYSVASSTYAVNLTGNASQGDEVRLTGPFAWFLA